jgi:hypothetical protein
MRFGREKAEVWPEKQLIRGGGRQPITVRHFCLALSGLQSSSTQPSPTPTVNPQPHRPVITLQPADSPHGFSLLSPPWTVCPCPLSAWHSAAHPSLVEVV